MQTNFPDNSVKELPLNDVWVGHPLSSEQATVLADGLLAIAHQAHNYPESEEFSINHWLSWLYEGGYDQVGFSEALQRICQRLLSVDDYKQLVALASGSANATRGLSAAIDHLSEHHSALLEQIHDIEKWRLADLEAIQATAGGLSKKAKIGLIAGGVYVGVSLVGGTVGAVGYFRARARERAKECLDSSLHNKEEHLEEKAANKIHQEVNALVIPSVEKQFTIKREFVKSSSKIDKFDLAVKSLAPKQAPKLPAELKKLESASKEPANSLVHLQEYLSTGFNLKPDDYIAALKYESDKAVFDARQKFIGEINEIARKEAVENVISLEARIDGFGAELQSLISPADLLNNQINTISTKLIKKAKEESLDVNFNDLLQEYSLNKNFIEIDKNLNGVNEEIASKKTELTPLVDELARLEKDSPVSLNDLIKEQKTLELEHASLSRSYKDGQVYKEACENWKNTDREKQDQLYTQFTELKKEYEEMIKLQNIEKERISMDNNALAEVATMIKTSEAKLKYGKGFRTEAEYEKLKGHEVKVLEQLHQTHTNKSAELKASMKRFSDLESNNEPKIKKYKALEREYTDSNEFLKKSKLRLEESNGILSERFLKFRTSYKKIEQFNRLLENQKIIDKQKIEIKEAIASNYQFLDVKKLQADKLESDKSLSKYELREARMVNFDRKKDFTPARIFELDEACKVFEASVELEKSIKNAEEDFRKSLEKADAKAFGDWVNIQNLPKLIDIQKEYGLQIATSIKRKANISGDLPESDVENWLSKAIDSGIDDNEINNMVNPVLENVTNSLLENNIDQIVKEKAYSAYQQIWQDVGVDVTAIEKEASQLEHSSIDKVSQV